MAAWDRWFSSDEDSCYFYEGPHREAFYPNFDGSTWMGPLQNKVDTFLSVEQTLSQRMIYGNSGHFVAICAVNPDSKMFMGYSQRAYYVNTYNQTWQTHPPIQSWNNQQ